MTATIKNIVLKDSRFIVFATINGVDETNAFMPEATAKDITTWMDERAAYHGTLGAKLIALKAELVGLDVKYADIGGVKEGVK